MGNHNICYIIQIHFSSLKRRGGFLGLQALMVGVGILLCYCLGYGLYWRYVAAVPPILYLVLFVAYFLIPESPIWNLSHKGDMKGRKALEWLR